MERREEAPQKGVMKLFFSMLWKARLPYLWIICYMAAAGTPKELKENSDYLVLTDLRDGEVSA